MGKHVHIKPEPVQIQGICVACEKNKQASKQRASTERFALAVTDGATECRCPLGTHTTVPKRGTVSHAGLFPCIPVSSMLTMWMATTPTMMPAIWRRSAPTAIA